MIKLAGTGHVLLRAADEEASTRFYRDVALRDAYAHLLAIGVEIERAIDHVCQRSLYYTDPDGNGLEIYYEMPNALSLFPNGRGDEDEALPLSGPADPLPQWLTEEWPG